MTIPYLSKGITGGMVGIFIAIEKEIGEVEAVKKLIKVKEITTQIDFSELMRQCEDASQKLINAREHLQNRRETEALTLIEEVKSEIKRVKDAVHEKVILMYGGSILSVVEEASFIVLMKDMWLCARLNILPLSEYINEFDFPYGPVVCTPSNGHSPGILATSLMKEKKELFRVEEKEDVAVFSLLPERKKEFKTIVDRMGIGDEIARVHEFVCKLYKDGFKKAEEFFKTLAELFQLLDAGMSFQYMHSRRRARVKRKSLEEIFIKVAQCCMHSLVSIGEISEKTGISKSTLYKWVGVWSEKGFFEVESGSFRLTEKGLEMLEACEKSRALKLEGQ